ncbi:MAG: PilZ domain-containing protein [Deltaproteobacteria bacterium]|nr:PilZ domain-containing protein [Deltaproteobacteria bacterium]MBW2131117.1 PilZ domain-containing protein [Deltaproteobacteria bacterium]
MSERILRNISEQSGNPGLEVSGKRFKAEGFSMGENKKKKQKTGRQEFTAAKNHQRGKPDTGLELMVITRETYRAPVDPSEPVRVQVGKKRFNAVNVARRGIGFIVSGSHAFIPGEVLDPFTVICGKTRISIKGRVVHVSPCEGGKYLCGIEILHSDPESFAQFEAYLERNRHLLFSKQKGDNAF